MFEIAETGARLKKKEYERRLPDLRVALVNAQFDLRSADFPVIIVVDGDDWDSVKNVLIGFSEWMDARYLKIHAMDRPTSEERKSPTLGRFWNRIPARGEIAVFTNAWTMGAVRDRVLGELDEDGFEYCLRQIRRFEADNANDGALILKFWLHLPKKELEKEIEKDLRKAKAAKGKLNSKADGKKRNARRNNGEFSLSSSAEVYYEHYDDLIRFSSRLIQVTDQAASPWHIVESTDSRHVAMTIGETVLEALQGRLEAPPPIVSRSVSPAVSVRADSILDRVDLTAALDRGDYKKQLAKHQDRLLELTTEAYERGIASVLVFEGWDAAGKGGVIRRVVRGTDLRRCSVVPVAAPTEEERAHHYLWRFWRRLARPGEMVIFDRSWYGRVLVERVEGLAPAEDWRRAYSEINHFEEQLTHAGIIVQKFWLHIDPDEQLTRFQAREQTAYKKYKITEEDYRNREKWDDYVVAVDEMVARTSTANAPWHLVPANDKPYARVHVLKEICAAFTKRL